MKAFFSKFDLFGERGVNASSEANDSPPADPSAKGMVRHWNRNIRKEIRKIDRDIGKMALDEKKVVMEMKALAAKKQISSIKILAKELVFMRKSRDRLLLTKTQLNSISNELTNQASVAKLAETFQLSASIMQSINKIVNLPEMHKTIVQMGQEMEKMGLIESVMGDAIDEALADPDSEELTEREINKVFEELALDMSSLMAPAGKDALKGASVKARNGVQLAPKVGENA